MTPEEIEAIIDEHKYPPLVEGETGINVVTLQIWLKMLGVYSGPTSGHLDEPTARAVTSFRAKHISAGPLSSVVIDKHTWEAMEDVLKQGLPPDPYTLERLPFPRRRDYDSEKKYQKALYEGLKSFGFPIKPAAQRIEFRLTTNADGVGRLSNLPPGEYDLTVESLNTAPTGSAEIRLVDENGEPLVGTAVLSGPGGGFSVRTQVDGVAVVDGIPQGEYDLIIKDVRRDVDETSAGSVEIRLVDQAGRPVSAHVSLSGDLGEANALPKAIKLFKAIVRGIDLYENKNGENRFPNMLSGELEESKLNHESWDSFWVTWGEFYGAPWMGIMLGGMDHIKSSWATFNLVRSLHQWGRLYLTTAPNQQALADRLQNPIVLGHLLNALGGVIEGQTDFSQIGSQVAVSMYKSYPIGKAGERDLQDTDWLASSLILLDDVFSQGRVITPSKIVIEKMTDKPHQIAIAYNAVGSTPALG